MYSGWEQKTKDQFECRPEEFESTHLAEHLPAHLKARYELDRP